MQFVEISVVKSSGFWVQSWFSAKINNFKMNSLVVKNMLPFLGSSVTRATQDMGNMIEQIHFLLVIGYNTFFTCYKL